MVAFENLASGFAALDRELPGGGWPCGALTELLGGLEGIGELQIGRASCRERVSIDV